MPALLLRGHPRPRTWACRGLVDHHLDLGARLPGRWVSCRLADKMLTNGIASSAGQGGDCTRRFADALRAGGTVQSEARLRRVKAIHPTLSEDLPAQLPVRVLVITVRSPLTNPTDSTICETYGYCAKDLSAPATRRMAAKRPDGIWFSPTAGHCRRAPARCSMSSAWRRGPGQHRSVASRPSRSVMKA